MKRFIGLLLLAGAIACPASAAILTGMIKKPDGNRLNGKVRLTLSNPARDISDSTVVVPTTVEFPIVGGYLPLTARVAGNDVLEPTHTYYWAEYSDAYGRVIQRSPYYIAGATFDLGQAQPTTITTSNIGFANIPRLGYFEVGKYGARGDGVTDDTLAIQRTIDAAKNAGGGTVFLPDGTYKSKRLTLESYVRLQGSDKWKCSLKLISGETTPLVYALNKSNITVNNLTLDGDLGSGGYNYVVNFIGVTDVEISDSVIHNKGNASYVVVVRTQRTPTIGCARIKILRNKIYSTSTVLGQGAVLHIGGSDFYPFSLIADVEIRDNRIYSDGVSAVPPATDDGILAVCTQGLKVIGNTISGVGGYGIAVDTYNKTVPIVSNNTATGCGYHGIAGLGTDLIVIPYNTGVTAFVPYATVTQLVSGATGTIIESSGGVAAGYVTLFQVSGTFNATNALQTGGVTVATASGAYSTYEQDAISFTDNSASANGHTGVAVLNGRGSIVSGNFVQLNGWRGIEISNFATDSQVTGNISLDNGSYAADPHEATGILIYVSRAGVSGNLCRNTSGAAQKYGISANLAGATVIGMGNTLTGNATAEWYLTATAEILTGFYSTVPIVQQVLATGAGATVDNVITALQNLGLVRQAP